MTKLIQPRWYLGIVTMFSLLLIGYSIGYAQSNYQIKVDVISGGGGISSSPNYILSFTIAQSSTIGIQSSINYLNEGGYIYAWLFWTSCSTPVVPTLFGPSGSGISTTPTLDWSDVSGADSYDVQVCSDSECSSVVRSATALNNSQWVVTPVLNNGTQYWWQARANNACGSSSYTDTWNFTTLPQINPEVTLQFSSATYSSNENGGSVLITVTRTGGSSGAVGVSYVASDGSAISGSDYTSTGGTLNWEDGDTSSKTFSVSILDDSVYEGDENVNLTLSSPTGGATLAFPSAAVLTIVDDDPVTYTLTLNVNPAATGSITKNPDKVTYVNGDSVQLTAIPNSGYNFINWSGDVIGNTNPISFIMDSNKSVTANFSIIPANNIIFVSLDGICNSYIPCFSSIQNAITSAGTQATIVITGETYFENVTLDNPKELILQGGWDSTFTSCVSNTAIQGSLTINDGTLTIKNIILQ